MTVGHCSPGQPSLWNTKHNLKHRVVSLPAESEGGDEMVRVQFPHAFDRRDEFWILLKPQPLSVNVGNWRFDHDCPLRGVNRPRSVSIV